MKLLNYMIHVDDPRDPITIIPFGCVHRDDPGFRELLFQKCIRDIETIPNTYAIGMGDYANFLRTTARTFVKSYVADDNSFRELDSMVKTEGRNFYNKYLSRIKTRLIGLAEGNHYHEFMNQTTDTQFLCDLASVPYLDKPAFIRLTIKMGKTKPYKTLRVLKILVHHGDWSGGNSRIGGDVGSAEAKSLGFGDFDIFLFGHTHRLWAMHIPTLTISTTGKLQIVERPRAFVRTGCFMSGYASDCVKSYAHKKLLPPTELGYVKLQIQFYREYDTTIPPSPKSIRPRQGGIGNWKYKFSVQY